MNEAAEKWTEGEYFLEGTTVPMESFKQVRAITQLRCESKPVLCSKLVHLFHVYFCFINIKINLKCGSF